MDRLLIIEPRLLVLNHEVDAKSSASVSLRNVMHTMPVAFKVQSSSPSKYTIKPPQGIIGPLGVISVDITILPQPELPDSVPHSQDKFVVRSVVVPGGKENENIYPEWFTAKKKQVYSDHGMKIIFVGGAILRRLVAQGCIDDIRTVLELDGRLVDSQDERGCTALHVATGTKRPELVALLLEFKANVDVKNLAHQTALHEAAARGEVLMVELLLAKDAKADATNLLGWAPLHSAVVSGQTQIVSLLAQKGVNLNAAALDGRTALHMAVDDGMRACMEILLEMGANVDPSDGLHKQTPLHKAAVKGDTKAIEILLHFGASTLAKDRRGRSPADVAREGGHSSFLLLDELSLGDDLRMSSRQGKAESIQGNLNSGALIDGVDEHRWTALHRAACRGHVSIVQMLLQEGADVKAQDDAGYTPLHCSTECNHKDVIMLLLQHGALVEERTFSGHTALDLAMLYGYRDTAGLLVDWVNARQGANKGVLKDGESNERSGVSRVRTTQGNKSRSMDISTPRPTLRANLLRIRTIRGNSDRNFSLDSATPKTASYAKEDVPLSRDRSALASAI